MGSSDLAADAAAPAGASSAATAGTPAGHLPSDAEDPEDDGLADMELDVVDGSEAESSDADGEEAAVAAEQPLLPGLLANVAKAQRLFAAAQSCSRRRRSECSPQLMPSVCRWAAQCCTLTCCSR